MTAGYSGTPLSKKLGIKEGGRVALLGAPPSLAGDLAPLPDAVTITTAARGKADVVVSFHTERRDFERRLPALLRVLETNGGLWVAWPKRAAKVPTDITEDVVREVALPIGLVDNKVCAIDEVWSGLRLVWRLERR